jgi:hypothetical protein
MSRVRLIAAALLVLAPLVLLAACGGEEQSSSEPRLPASLAEDLAQRSEAVRAQLRAGNACVAASRARSMEQAIEAAIAAGNVPGALQAELVRTARTLRADIHCEAESTPSATVAEAETGGTTEQATVDRCAQLEQELETLEEQKQELEEQQKEQEHEDDKDERKRQKDKLKEQKKAIEEQRRELEEELRVCEEQE